MVLVQVLRGGGVSESLYLLVVSLFLWLFWGGGHPSEGRGGGCHRCAGGAASSARRGAASCFVGAAGRSPVVAGAVIGAAGWSPVVA